MKKISLFLSGLFLIALLALAACGGGGDEEPPPASLPAPTAIPVAPAAPTAIPIAPAPTPVPSPTPLPTLPSPTATPTVIVEEVTEAGTLSILEGKAEFRPEGSAVWLTATDGMPVTVDSHVRTLNVSTAVIQFAEGSRVQLEPNTELVVEVFKLLSGGPPTGQRVVKVRLVDGSISFDVTSAPTPPNVWEFLTVDGVIAIHGTQGTLSSRESAEQLVLNILEGAATLAHVRIDDDTGEPELNLFTVEDGSVVSLPSSARGLTGEAIDTLLGIAEIIALGGKEAVEQVSASGDIDAGVAIGLNAFAGVEGAAEVVAILSEVSEVLEAAGDRISLVSGVNRGAAIEFGLIAATLQYGIVQVSLVGPGAENIGNFVSSSLDKIAAVSALGKLPDSVADLLEG
ncbi:MAG: FecR domain-containing protein, partial [Chloroflexi bacterium]|nr:FecR domain-containing protein [Chloroflexota bacterium]